LVFIIEYGLTQAAASTELPAGGKLPNSHCTFCGTAPPLAPNRLVGGRFFLQYLLFFKSIPFLHYFSKAQKNIYPKGSTIVEKQQLPICCNDML
jgi:hypothetical protein